MNERFQVARNLKMTAEFDRQQLRAQFDQMRSDLAQLSNAKSSISGEEAHRIAQSYQALCQIYARLSTFYPDTPESKEALQLVMQGRRLIYGTRLGWIRGEQLRFMQRVRKAARIIRRYCAISAAVAISAGLVTALMVQLNPDFGWHFINEQTAANLSQGKLWTEQIRGLSSVASSQIATNNIQVSLIAFAMGVTGGIGTMIMLLSNGAMIGGLLMVTGHYSQAGALFEFMISHGILEISIIFVAAGCGLALGDALLHPGNLSRGDAMRETARNVFPVLLFSAGCLIPAGLVEGYISPYEEIPLAMKVIVGIVLGASYWWLLYGTKEEEVYKRPPSLSS